MKKKMKTKQRQNIFQYKLLIKYSEKKQNFIVHADYV